MNFYCPQKRFGCRMFIILLETPSCSTHPFHAQPSASSEFCNIIIRQILFQSSVCKGSENRMNTCLLTHDVNENEIHIFCTAHVLFIITCDKTNFAISNFSVVKNNNFVSFTPSTVAAIQKFCQNFIYDFKIEGKRGKNYLVKI